MWFEWKPQWLGWVSSVQNSLNVKTLGIGSFKVSRHIFIPQIFLFLKRTRAKEGTADLEHLFLCPGTYQPIILISALQPKSSMMDLLLEHNAVCLENIHFRQTIKAAQVGPWLLSWCRAASGICLWCLAEKVFFGCTNSRQTPLENPVPCLCSKQNLNFMISPKQDANLTLNLNFIVKKDFSLLIY